MAASTLTISGNMVGAAGNLPISDTIIVAAPLGIRTGTTLASGFNSIAVPTGATLITIKFPDGNAVAVTLKGITGDTGLLLNPAGENVLQLTAAQTTIGITAAGAISALTYITFN